MGILFGVFVYFLSKVWLVLFVYEVSIFYSGIFDIWSKFASEIFQQVDQIGPMVSQGMPTSVQGGAPQSFRKTGRNK